MMDNGGMDPNWRPPEPYYEVNDDLPPCPLCGAPAMTSKDSHMVKCKSVRNPGWDYRCHIEVTETKWEQLCKDMDFVATLRRGELPNRAKEGFLYANQTVYVEDLFAAARGESERGGE